MTIINELHELRAECRAVLSKIPNHELNNFEQASIKTLLDMEARLYKLSEQLRLILPEAE